MRSCGIKYFQSNILQQSCFLVFTMSSSSRFFQFSPSLDDILVCDTVIWATERAPLLGWSLEVISPSINALSSTKTVLRTDWTWRKLSKEPMNLLSCCMISHPIGCTIFRRAAKKLVRALSKVYNEFINFISKQNSSIFVYSASNQVWYTIEKSLGKFGSLCFLLYTKRRQIFSI